MDDSRRKTELLREKYKEYLKPIDPLQPFGREPADLMPPPGRIVQSCFTLKEKFPRGEELIRTLGERTMLDRLNELSRIQIPQQCPCENIIQGSDPATRKRRNSSSSKAKRAKKELQHIVCSAQNLPLAYTEQQMDNQSPDLAGPSVAPNIKIKVHTTSLVRGAKKGKDSSQSADTSQAKADQTMGVQQKTLKPKSAKLTPKKAQLAKPFAFLMEEDVSGVAPKPATPRVTDLLPKQKLTACLTPLGGSPGLTTELSRTPSTPSSNGCPSMPTTPQPEQQSNSWNVTPSPPGQLIPANVNLCGIASKPMKQRQTLKSPENPPGSLACGMSTVTVSQAMSTVPREQIALTMPGRQSLKASFPTSPSKLQQQSLLIPKRTNAGKTVLPAPKQQFSVPAVTKREAADQCAQSSFLKFAAQPFVPQQTQHFTVTAVGSSKPSRQSVFLAGNGSPEDRRKVLVPLQQTEKLALCKAEHSLDNSAKTLQTWRSEVPNSRFLPSSAATNDVQLIMTSKLPNPRRPAMPPVKLLPAVAVGIKSKQTNPKRPAVPMTKPLPAATVMVDNLNGFASRATNPRKPCMPPVKPSMIPVMTDSLLGIKSKPTNPRRPIVPPRKQVSIAPNTTGVIEVPTRKSGGAQQKQPLAGNLSALKSMPTLDWLN